jgi:hypothetical protein
MEISVVGEQTVHVEVEVEVQLLCKCQTVLIAASA